MFVKHALAVSHVLSSRSQHDFGCHDLRTWNKCTRQLKKMIWNRLSRSRWWKHGFGTYKIARRPHLSSYESWSSLISSQLCILFIYIYIYVLVIYIYTYIYTCAILHLRCRILFYTKLLYWTDFSIVQYPYFSIVQYFVVLIVVLDDTEHSPVLLSIFSAQI